MAKRGNYLDYYMTHQEIADELGISRQMVRNIEYQALKNSSVQVSYVLSWIISTT